MHDGFCATPTPPSITSGSASATTISASDSPSDTTITMAPVSGAVGTTDTVPVLGGIDPALIYGVSAGASCLCLLLLIGIIAALVRRRKRPAEKVSRSVDTEMMDTAAPFQNVASPYAKLPDVGQDNSINYAQGFTQSVHYASPAQMATNSITYDKAMETSSPTITYERAMPMAPPPRSAPSSNYLAAPMASEWSSASTIPTEWPTATSTPWSSERPL
jgi:hypothetical protein